MTANVWSYIGRTKEANRNHKAHEVVAAVVDCVEMERELPKIIAKWMRDGLLIERVPVEWVRKYLGTTELYNHSLPIENAP